MPEFTYTVNFAEAVTSTEEFLRTHVDVPKFLECCKQCMNYNNRWSCPTFQFDPVQVWKEFKTLHLFARFIVPGKDRDGAKLMAALKKEQPQFLAELLVREKTTPGSMALAPGACELCGDCARSIGQPCRHPELMRHSIEALGGDVGATAQDYFGKPMLWIKDGVAPDYLMLVGGLLTR